MAISSTELASLAKTIFTGPVVEGFSMRKQPFLGMLKKKTDCKGEVGWQVPVLHAEQAGASANFTQAQTNADSSYLRASHFLVTPVNMYQIARMNGRTVRALQGDRAGYIEGWKRTIESAFNNLSRVMGQNLLSVGQWGALGICGSTTGATITLATREDIVNFEVGDILVAADTEAGDTLHSSGATLTVSAVDYDTGILTMSGTVSATWTEPFAAGDYLFRVGDRESSATPTARLMASVIDYIPQTAPTTSLFGLSRTGNSKLGGGRYDGSALTIREALIRGASRARAQGGDPDYCFMNEEDYAELQVEMAGAIRYVDVKAGSTGQLTYSAIELPDGVKAIGDVNVKRGHSLMLQMNTWELMTIGDAPGFLNSEDGNDFLRVSNADALEVRVGYYGNLACRAPGWNYNIKLATS